MLVPLKITRHPSFPFNCKTDLNKACSNFLVHFCCVFWPAFSYCMHLKAGWNIFFSVLRLFSSFQPFCGWIEEKYVNKSFFDDSLWLGDTQTLVDFYPFTPNLICVLLNFIFLMKKGVSQLERVTKNKKFHIFFHLFGQKRQEKVEKKEKKSEKISTSFEVCPAP